MAISFEKSLKTSNMSKSIENAIIAPLVATDIDVAIPAYSPADFVDQSEWILDDKYLYYEDYSDDITSQVDKDKNIIFSAGQVNITQETNSQYIPFEMPRYYDGFDLSKTTLLFHFVNPRGRADFDSPVNVFYNNTKIKFAWLVDERVTAVEGNIKFEIQAIGVNSKGDEYIWKTRPSDDINVLKSLSGNGIIEPDSSWISGFLSQVTDQVSYAQTAAQNSSNYSKSAKSYSDKAEAAASMAQSIIDDAKSELQQTIDTEVAGKIAESMSNYHTKDEIASLFDNYDISDKLEDIKRQISSIDDLSKFSVEYDGHAMVFYNGDTVIKEISINSDPSEEWTTTYTKVIDDKISEHTGNIQDDLDDFKSHISDNYYKKTDSYSAEEIDSKLSSVTVDLTGYATEEYVDDKSDALSSFVEENTGGIASLNRSVTEINQILESIDRSARVTYDATYGDVELEDGTIAEDMFTLWKTENGVREMQDRFQIQGGGGGTGSSVTLRIAYVDGYTTPIVATVDDSAIVRYNFTGEDSAGDTNLDGTASWKVGNRVVATQEVSTGEREFDLTDYVTVGDNKIVLTITHATGAIATKAWTVKIVDVRLESKFDDTKTNPANSPVAFSFIPYGGIAKTVHFLLDGDEIGTKISSAAAAGLSDSFLIPAYDHGSHLLEVYMTADVNGKTVESNRIVKDIIWYDYAVGTPVIGCTQQKLTVRQYEAVNITYTVFDPKTETPNVSLRATYKNDAEEAITEYDANVIMTSNTETWQFKTDILGEHTLTITCGSTIKTLIVTVKELGITVSPVTSGLVFDFNPVGLSNNDTNRLWSNNGVSMSVSPDFDWVNGGYSIDEDGNQYFCIKAGTSAEIDYELFGDDAKVNGKEFKLIFKTRNVSSSDAMFLSCVSDTIGTDKIGLEMRAHEATIYAKTSSLPLPYAEDEVIEFEFNISASNENPSMVMGYEDGVSTRPLVYDSTHDFQQYQGHRKKISLGSDYCDLHIYRFKVYNTSLSDRDILNNFIADSRSAEEMIKRYERNQIYKEGILDPDYLAEVCPQLRIIKLEVPWFTNDKDDKVYDANRQSVVECIYKDGDPIYDNWVAYDIVHSGQGTTSNNYGPAGRNLDLILKPYKDYGNNPYIILGNGSRVNKVSLTRESIPVNYFNVKVNIASSENANNALMQKRYNQYNPYNRPFVREDASIIPYIKDTMEFHNAVIFVKESDPVLTTHREFNDNNWHFYALGNIGDSKKTDSTRLTDPTDRYECILEVMDNTLPNSTMPTGKVDKDGAPVYPINTSEWGVGNPAYDSLYADRFDESKATEKDNGLADTYGWRYIYEDGTDEENAAVKAYVEQKWKDFYGFVVTSTDEEFKEHLGDWCVLDSVMYYYLFVLRYTLTDNFAKNSFWHYGKSNDLDSDGNHIRKWDLCFDYDNDTCLGIDNYGRMTYRYGYEEDDYVDGTKDWVWNAPNHVFFLRLKKLFDKELCDLYITLESSGCWSATSLINQWNDWQAEFPEELWRIDTQRKYIRTYTESYIGGKAYPEFLVERANGRKKTQRSQFERNQEKYMSSKFGGTVASADDIILRCSVPNTALAVKPRFDITLTAFSHVYANVKYNTEPPRKYKLKPNETFTFKYIDEEKDGVEGEETGLADVIEIYSASCLKSIGDLSACYLTNGSFANATKITELILGNSTDGYANTNVMTLGLGSNELLTKLDIQNMSGLSHSLDLSKLKNLKELYAFGSSVGGVIFADGGNIEIAQIPDVGTLEMRNLHGLTDVGFDSTSFFSLSKLVAENSSIDLVRLINSCPNLRQVRIVGVNWTLDDTSLLDRLYEMSGVSTSGANTDKSVLTGAVHIPVIKQRQLYNFQSSWPDLEITYDSMIEQFAVTFSNHDGSILEIQYVDKGSDAVDPTLRAESPMIPMKESSVQYDYAFAGWDVPLTAIFTDRVVTATYYESLRQYTIKYVSKGAVMQESIGYYGTNVPYTGSTPVYTAEEPAYVYYLFNRWNNSGFIDGEKTVEAIFDKFEYTSTAFDGVNLHEMTPVQIYALTKLGIADKVIEDKDRYDIVVGSDVEYDDIESDLLIADKTVFDGTNYIDTGISLFDEDRDFVLAIDYKFLAGNTVNSTLAQCFQANGSNGFKLWYSNGVRFTWGTSAQDIASVDKREMVVIRHRAGDNNLTIYNSNLDGDSVITVELERTRTTTGSSTLVFGATKADDGIMENFAIGHINWCKIWYKDLGNEVCNQLAMWTHEKITMEACGFRKYYLSDNPSKRCSFSLLATHLLDRTRKWHTLNSNEGGWETSPLRASLNDRLYKSMPEQLRSLIKLVRVPSSIGNKSAEISTSDCYITIPAAIEVDPTMTSEPYINEGTAISYLTNNESRKRGFDGGDYYQYWLRSPHIQYSNYVWRVNEDGSMYGYNIPYYDGGILIEVSI